LLRRAKLAFKDRAKTVASPCEANSSGEAIPAWSTTKKVTFKASPKAFQPKQANFQPPRVSMLDWLSPANTDLREFSNNKRKLCFEESVHVSPSQCRQAGCQLVTVYSVYFCLGMFGHIYCIIILTFLHSFCVLLNRLQKQRHTFVLKREDATLLHWLKM